MTGAESVFGGVSYLFKNGQEWWLGLQYDCVKNSGVKISIVAAAVSVWEGVPEKIW